MSTDHPPFTNVHIVVVSTASRHKFQQFQKQTVKRWNYAYTSLGEGVKWEGFVTKMALLTEYFRSLLDSDGEDASNVGATLYVVADAYDLVFTGPPEELLEKYLQFKVPIVVGSERTCFGNCLPTTCPAPNTDTGRLFVNGGCVMGGAQDLFEYYGWGTLNSPADDQIAMSKYRNLFCDLIGLDFNAEIVLNYVDAVDVLTPIGDGRLSLRTKGSGPPVTPCIIHCPGIYQDLGKRWNFVLSHIIPDYIPTYTQKQYFHFMMKHSTSEIRNNKSYFILTLAASYGVLLFLLALVIGAIYAFLAGKRAMEQYENGH